MNELLNFHNTLVVGLGNWWLVLLALALGIWVGWTKSQWVPGTDKGERQ